MSKIGTIKGEFQYFFKTTCLLKLLFILFIEFSFVILISKTVFEKINTEE